MTGDEAGRESGLRGSRLWAREAGRTLSTAAGTNTAQSRQPQEPPRAHRFPPSCFFLRDLHHGMGAEGLFPPRSHLLHFPSPLPSWRRKAVLVSEQPGLGWDLPALHTAGPARRGPRGDVHSLEMLSQGVALRALSCWVAGSRGAHRTAGAWVGFTRGGAFLEAHTWVCRHPEHCWVTPPEGLSAVLQPRAQLPSVPISMQG